MGREIYKASNYNYFSGSEEGFNPNPEKQIGINTLTRKCIELDKDEFAMARTILVAPNSSQWETYPLRKLLIDRGFLVEQELDELGLVRVKDRLARFNTDHLDLAINLTHNCNFRCIYCYKPPRPEAMSPETAERIIRFVEQRSKTIKSLSIRWYGGEPLLQFPLLREMGRKFCEIAARREIRFFSAVLTNGSLLTPDKAEFLTNELKVGYIAVPLDGPPPVHDARRPLANGRGTFETIVKNLRQVCNLNPAPPVFIRINLDQTNLDSGTGVLELLDQAGLAGKVGVTFGQIVGLTQACASAVDGLCIPRGKFISTIAAYGLESNRRGFQMPQLQDLTKPGRCIAVCTNSYIVAPNGDLYKCDNETGLLDLRVGRFTDGNTIQFETNLVKWLAHDITERKECRECVLLPICMGGCAYRWIKGIDREPDERGQCSEWERSILKLRILYQFFQADQQIGLSTDEQ